MYGDQPFALQERRYAAAVTDCGMGLSNIASRINSLNGRFDITSAKGVGMQAKIRVSTQAESAEKL